jgi:NADH-quinone oxidoreductase subunit N
MSSLLPRLAQFEPEGLPVGGGGAVDDGVLQIATPSVDWAAVAPILVLALGALLLLAVDSLWRGRKPSGFYALWTVVTAGAAGLATIPMWDRLDESGAFSTVGGALGVDGFGLLITAVICSAVFLGALIAKDYLPREGLDGPGFYVLMLLSATGGVIMAMSNDLIVLFVGLETLSIAAYVLAAMQLKRIQSQEAGMKYFVLGAFSSAFFLYGIAMIYGATGTTNLVRINAFLSQSLLRSDGLLLLGMVLMLVGLGFKVAAVPFHFWAPDVYDGAPGPVVAYMASGIKAAGFAGIIRVFYLTFPSYADDWRPIIFVLAVLSLAVGSVLAIVQSDVKRMLAYSSISHAGFILVGVEAATQAGVSAVLFYLATYTFLVAGSFAVVTLVDQKGDAAHELTDYRGLGRSSPVLAFTFTILLLAQAGVPLTSGFFAKFYVISASVEAESYWLAGLAMGAAVIAAFLYLRLIVTMWMSTDADGVAEVGTRIRVPFATGLALAICFVVTVGVGIWPQPAVEWSEEGEPFLVEFEQPLVDDFGGGLGF